MEDNILGIPKVAVYFVIAIVLPLVIFIAACQAIVFGSINNLAIEQGNTKQAVERLAVTPTVQPSAIPSPTVFAPTQSLTKPTVKSATRSGQVR